MRSPSLRPIPLSLLAATVLALAACGGGGGGGGGSSVPAPVSTTVPVASTCPQPPAPGTGTAYQLGAARTWCLSVATIGTSNLTYQGVATTLEGQSTYLNVWVDNADVGQLTQSEWQQVADDFVSIYTTDVADFGSPRFPQLGTAQTPNTFAECTSLNGPSVSNYEVQPNFSVDNNGYGQQIDLVITDKLGSGEGGYFSAINLVANASALCANAYSNEAEVIFAESPVTSQGSEPVPFYLYGDALRTEAHEFQHLLHSVNKTYVGFAQSGTEVFDPSWIDEGFSMLAEDLAFPSLASSPTGGPSGDPIRYAFAYLSDPSSYSLTSFEGYDCSPTATSTNCPKSIYNYTAGNYGAAYLFWRWAVDQKNVGILKQVIDDRRADANGNAVNNGVTETLTAFGGTYATFNTMFDDFAIALAASQHYSPTGPFAYTVDPNQNNSYAFDNSYRSYTIPSPCKVPNPEPNVTCDLTNNTATFTFKGPQPPTAATQFASPLGVTPETVHFYAGTANFVPIASLTPLGSVSFSATDATGGGGIVGGYVAQNTTGPSTSAAECSTAASKVGCTVYGSGTGPSSVVFPVGLGNPPANSGGSTPSLTQYTVDLKAANGNTIPAPTIGAASIARLPEGIATRSLADGFLRPDRPAAEGQRALRRLFARGVVHGPFVKAPQPR